MTKPALSSTDVQAVVKDLDARRSAVAAEIAAGGDITAFQRVDAGPVLASDTLEATERRARGDAMTAGRQSNDVGRTWSARFATYPLWAFVEVKPDLVRGQPGNGATYIDVLERSAVVQDWKIAYDVLVEETAVPSSSPETVDATVSASDLVKVAEALRPSAAYLSVAAATEPSPAKILPALHEALHQVVIDQTTVHTTCDLWAGGPGAASLTRAVRTPEGIFGTSMLRCTKTTAADAGREIWWNEPHAKAIGGDTRHVQTLTELFGVSLAVLLRDDGSTTVVGGDLYFLPLSTPGS